MSTDDDADQRAREESTGTGSDGAVGAGATGGTDRSELGGDVLPADLQRDAITAYDFPDNSRRRVPGLIYLGIAALVAVLAFTVLEGGSHVNQGLLLGCVGLVVVGVFHLQAGWRLGCDETEALSAATKQIGFPVGHASAQMAWRGFRSRPTWRVLLFSAEDPPVERGLVLVDGPTGDVVDLLREPNVDD